MYNITRQMRKPRGYWNYEHCFQEAQKYKTRMDFKEGCSSAYNVAKNNKWLDDYTWFQKSEIWNKYWTKELCEIEAKKYSYSTEFRKNCSGAWIKAYKEGWLQDYTWFEDGNKICADKKRIWTKETCYELALKCKSRSDLKKHNAQAYKVAREMGWLDDYTWFRSGFDIYYEDGIKWTYEKCLEESKKYYSRKEFCEKCVGGYTRALKRGWINDFTWLKNENIMADEVDSIYGYFFDGNVVYIGRTLIRTQNKRHTQHIKDENDTVYRYAKLNSVDIPQMTILEKYLTLEEGSKREGYWVEYYKKNGYYVLNKQGTGGIGGIGRGKWNKKSCYNEALKFSSMDEFYTNSAAAYRVANDKGWIEEYTWLRRKYTRRNYWQNYDNCFNEAKKYDTISEFNKNAPGAYNSATDNGWIDDYTWFVRNTPKKEYTYDICYSLAKKCKNTTEFIKASSTAYRVAKENDWLKDYVWFKKIVRWTDEEVLKLACRYSSELDFRKENSGAYNYMQKHSLPKPNSWKANKLQWNYDTCYAEASKYKKRSEYRKNSKTSYNVAHDNGWLDDFTWLKISSMPHGFWTYERCHEEAKKYKTKREFEKGSPGAYDAVISHKWMPYFEYLFVYGQKPKGYWNNYDNCYKEALKYSKVSHFKKECMGAYSSSIKHGWIKDYTWFNTNNGQLNLFE